MKSQPVAYHEPVSTEPEGPLVGVNVVALEQSVAGPIASRILGDMGADVIKIEPQGGDFARHWDSHVRGYSSHFVWLSRRKRSIALDLRTPKDRTIFESLIGSADVLIFNTSVDSAERLELTPERLTDRYPGLIACQITGYGRSGSARHRKAYDMLIQAESGLMALTGDDEGPVRIGLSICDVGTGIYASSLILGALVDRLRTGKGRFIDLSMFEVMTEFAGPNLVAYANGAVKYDRYRWHHHSIVPYGIFRCRDGFLAIAIEQDLEWKRFCKEVLGRQDLAVRSDLATNEQRVARREEVQDVVSATLRLSTVAESCRKMEAASLAYGLINDIEAVWDHNVSKAFALQSQARLIDGTLVHVPRSPAEHAFNRTDIPRIPRLDEDHGEIAARHVPEEL